MKRSMLCLFIAMLVVGSIFTLPGKSGDKKSTIPGKVQSGWKGYIPDDVFKELTSRSIMTIEDQAKAADKNSADKIKVEAVILEGYAGSAKNPKVVPFWRAHSQKGVNSGIHNSLWTSRLRHLPTNRHGDFKCFCTANGWPSYNYKRNFTYF